MQKIILILFTFLTLHITVVGQNKKNIAQPELDTGTIEQQFDYIITKSSKFKDFQLIRLSSILKVKDHALDSIQIVRKELIKANKSVAQIEGNIAKLENEVQSLKDEINTISEGVNSISFFGTPLSKATYNTIVWSIIIVLLLALIVLIIRFKKSHMDTKRTQNDLNKLEIDFEAFRKKSLKKEQEIMRKLQDEINKNNP